MPTYDYRCETTGEIFEVRHSMNESITTWSELCEISGREVGNVPGDSPVTKLATGGNVVSSKSLGNKVPPCGAGGGCSGGACGFNG
ncbi:MAG: zinc ribbon domain-containing protein [Gammaproteobacteria bacterium]|nr:zinc ribbon domain-containing protein [Gammaproteobacteria bacterium]